MYYLLDFATTHIKNSSAAGDVVTALAIQAIVLYLGVFFEPHQRDPMQEIQRAGYSAMGKLADQWMHDISKGNYDNEKIRAMQRVMPPDARSAFEPLITQDGTAELWDSTKLANFLLAPFSLAEQAERFDSTQRTINNRLAKYKDDPTYGIRPKDKGRGLLIPWDRAALLFADEIQRVVNHQKPFTLARKRPARAAAPVQQENGTDTELERQTDDAGMVKILLPPFAPAE